MGASAANAFGSASWIYNHHAQQPAQRRSRRTFYRFLDAAEGLLAERQWHEVSVQDIVKQARASVGAFYNRFSDKSALLGCLDERLAEECDRTIDGLVAEFRICPALLADAPGILVSLMIRLLHSHAGIVRALDIATKMAGPGAPEKSLFGLGVRFDRALERYAAHMVAADARFAGRDAEDVLTAFQETFWIARERLIYNKGGVAADTGEAPDLHGVLMRHLAARLGG